MREYKTISSKLYDLTKPTGLSLDGDLEFYHDQIKDMKGPILEAGTGTGRLLIPYLEEGLNMEGVDFSQEMLDICQNKLNEKGLQAPIYKEDLLEMDLKKTYEAIIMPTGSICLIDQIDRLLENFYRHLEPGGKLLVDLIYPLDFELGSQTQIYPVNDRENIVFTSFNQKIDLLEQKTYSINRYESWVDEKLEASEISNFNLNWYGIREFSAILKEHKFTDISYLRGYGGQADYLVTFMASKK